MAGPTPLRCGKCRNVIEGNPVLVAAGGVRCAYCGAGRRPKARREPSRAAHRNVPRISEEPISGKGKRGALLIVMLLVISGIVGTYGLRSWNRQAEAPPGASENSPSKAVRPAVRTKERREAAPDFRPEAPVSTNKVKRNVQGEVVRVAAMTPMDVLRSFCESYEPLGTCVPVEVTEVNPPRIGMRLGLFRDLRNPEETQAIIIRSGGGSRGWVAGKGRVRIGAVQPKPHQLGKGIPAGDSTRR